jgi:predicted permease
MLHYALRSLRREPALLLAATGTLAVAIAAATAVFSIADAVLLRPLPYPHSDRLYWVDEAWGRAPDGMALAPDYYSIRRQPRPFEDVAAYEPITVNWTATDSPEQLQAAAVTASFFRVMGARPLLGRYLSAGEEGANSPPVAVLSYAFWQTRFAADPQIAGRTMLLDRLPVTVIGVMPQGFDYPHGVQLWRPIDIDQATQLPRSAMRPARLVYMLARLRPGITPDALENDLAVLGHDVRAEYPPEFETAGFLKGFRIRATPLRRRIAGDLRPAVLVLSGAVALVLLIACVNLANLLLARAAAHRRELAVRLALGAPRRRIAGQMMIESLLLALPGGLAGLAIASFVVAALNRYKPLVLDRYPVIPLDLRTVAFTCAATVFTGLLFGMAPALSASGSHIADALKSAGHSQTGGAGAAQMRRILVIAEVAVSLVLLVGACLLARSFWKLGNVPLGFPSDRLVTMRVKLTGSRYASGPAQIDFYQQVLARLRRLPMVRSAAVATDVPLSGERPFTGREVQVEGRPPLPPAQRPHADGEVVSPEFFVTMGIPLVAGRLFDAHDVNAVVVNQAFATRVFPGESALGGRIAGGQTIVGIVSNIRGSSLGAEPLPVYYSCACGGGNRFLTRMALIVRTAADPRPAIRAIQEQVYAVDRDQPVFDVETMEDRLASSLAPQRFQLALVGTFAGIAILLAAAGVYGVISYLMARRRREIAIRMALGARPGDVVTMVLRESLALAGIGIVFGIGGALALMRYAGSMLYGVSAADAVSFIVAAAVLMGAVIASAAAPARRAARLDPLAALRQE